MAIGPCGGEGESLGSLWRIMCPTTTGEDDPLVDGAPALEGLASGRVLVCIGEGDVLRGRGRAYYDRIRASGWRGEAEIWHALGKGHTFHLLEPCCDEAVTQDKVISDFLNRRWLAIPLKKGCFFKEA